MKQLQNHLTATTDDYLTKAELVAMFKHCGRTIKRWSEQGLLPRPISFGKRPLWRRSDIEECLAKRNPKENQL